MLPSTSLQSESVRWDRRHLEVRPVFTLEHREISGAWRFDAYTDTYAEAISVVADLAGYRITQRFALVTVLGLSTFVIGFHDTEEEALAALEVERSW